jgi:dethiobiotin synthetase
MKTLFISGNDTDVGKTHVGVSLVTALVQRGYQCVPRKPIESGCKETTEGLHPADASAYFEACQKTTPLSEICPLRYVPAISPERAIRLAKQSISVQQLVELCRPNNTEAFDYLIVEGAGGLYSPLCTDGLNADLAQALEAAVILVINDRLGCINQTLLCLEALKARNLTPVAIVLNQCQASADRDMDNFEDLKLILSLPLIAFPHADVHPDEKNHAIDQLVNLIEKL